MEAREFPIGEILSVTTGRLVCERGYYGLVDILNFMTEDELWEHQINRALDECEPVLLLQHPQLADIDAANVTEENLAAWLSAQAKTFGATLPVEPCGPGVHQRIDPVSEAAEKVHPDRLSIIRR